MALSAAPDNADIHVNLGDCLLAQKRPAEAAQEYREALRLDPASKLARKQLSKLRRPAAPPN